MKTLTASLLLIVIFQYQSLSAVISSENILDEILVQNICNNFSEAKCPYDDYCFYNIRVHDRACFYCPTGGDCDEYLTEYDKPNMIGMNIDDAIARDNKKCPESKKYYHHLFACTWRNNCPVESKINNNTITSKLALISGVVLK